MANNKKSIYSKYIARLEETLNTDFYFEMAWLEYVLLEDWLVSLLKITGGELDG